MTSSLPDFSPSPAAAPAVDASSLAALLPAATAAGAGSEAAPTTEFSLLMGTPSAPAVAAASTAAEPPAGVVACASTSTRLRATPDLVAPTGPAAVVVTNLAPAGVTNFAPAVVTNLAPAAGQGSVAAGDASTEVPESVEPAEPGTSREVTRDTLEEAAAFVTSLLQGLLPEVQLPEFSVVAYQRVPSTMGSSGGLWATGPARAAIASGQELPPDTAAMPAPNGAAPKLFTLTADGAIELNLDLAQFKPTGSDTPSAAATAALEISAALEREGEVDLRLEAAAMVAPGTHRPVALASALGREIFAGKKPVRNIDPELLAEDGERNFVFTGDKQLKPASPVAGISVAKTDITMPVAPIEETRATRNPETISVLPLRPDFQVAAPPAERIAVPDSAPAGQNFAERAVETVTNLVDTQFTASLQKAGSVHLHLRFGGEDLTVRVEIKDGAVQTDFRTDSAELRSALAREWEAVAAQSPEQMRRYLEPIFAPSTAATASAGDSPSFSSRQQQQHAQQDQSSRAAREAWFDPTGSFTRRSPRSDTLVPATAAVRGPSLLPTSVRLSVLA
ncbi:MAG TPA: hypothetical protein VG734_10275 [Lacunisphaera sp.]|nr:hypothetical protein [Lacunisphaera sp.]